MGLTAAIGTVVGALPAAAAEPEPPRSGPAPMALNVQNFGAVGDCKKGNTEAFTAAMKAAAEIGNGAVFVPRGRYLVTGSLEVPEGVMLEGVFRAPSARSRNSGSLLLAVAGAGGAKGVIRTKCI
jgi:hypothetical protein